MLCRLAWMFFVFLSSTVLAFEGHAFGDMAGERSRPIQMDGAVRVANSNQQYRFVIEIERIGFLLNSVQNKYKLVRVRVENNTTIPLGLSVERDQLDLVLGNDKTVPAIFNLQRSDSVLWDSFDVELRKVLAYPKTIGVAARPPETIYFFAFFPKDQIVDVPKGFRYKIDSLGQTVPIEHRATAAR